MRSALVFGGSGALGSVVGSTFVSKGWNVISVDTKLSAENVKSMVLDFSKLPTTDAEVTKLFDDLPHVDAVINVAGGWAGGNAASPAFVESCDLMYRQSVVSSVFAAKVASQKLNKNGLVVLTGAQAAAQGGTSFMIGYGMAKAAVHHLTKSLAADDSGLPEGARALCILPNVLDTPGNRAGMPDSDFTSWTPLEQVAELIVKWSEGSGCPANGSLVSLKTTKGQTAVSFS